MNGHLCCWICRDYFDAHFSSASKTLVALLTISLLRMRIEKLCLIVYLHFYPWGMPLFVTELKMVQMCFHMNLIYTNTHNEFMYTCTIWEWTYAHSHWVVLILSLTILSTSTYGVKLVSLGLKVFFQWIHYSSKSYEILINAKKLFIPYIFKKLSNKRNHF